MKKVMLVEDEELILQGLRNILDWEALGLKVVHMAHDGLEALKMWEKEPVHIVVTDISMPEMDGLALLKKIREKEEQVRFIILTGYDEFDYAREAIRLEVENYILKPIDEEELERQLKETVQKLEEMDKKKIQYIDEKTQWIHFLGGGAQKEEYGKYMKLLGLSGDCGTYHAAVMKWKVDGLKEKKITDVIVELKKKDGLSIVHLPPDSLLMVLSDRDMDETQVQEYFAELQNQIDSKFNVMTFVGVGPSFYNFEELPNAYKKAKKLQKYLIIEGYGSCISQSQIRDRKSGTVSMDESRLRKYILKKEKDAAVDYMEDVFIGNIQKDASVSSLYQTAVHMAMLIQEIKKEYKLESGGFCDLSELIETIFGADDILGIKTAFVSEITEIIECMHEEDSQYTPVVRQIIAEVQHNYKEDMNLKTLAYKYHMNASYLGQIFQREVGCSFAQYLSNTKNSIAKDLILNTNMKINDIAREVGYPDTSYFYRKFKQCYGVSPASLREMKKY
ncbi:MAG: response regulator [Dorea sp.]|jgi:two-component system response regulator YesN|nr:response regulator [Dorea sp.]